MPIRSKTGLKRRGNPLNQGQVNWLYDLDHPLDNPWLDRNFMSKDELNELWTANRDDVIKWFVENKPCSRPGPWWKYDAPKELVNGCTGSEFYAYQAYRQRLGGIGTPNYEVLAHCPNFHLGIPDSWVSQFDADYYNGRAVNIHGAGIGNGKEGDFGGLTIDPGDPPAFESQAAYLQRNGLLTTPEKAYLKKHPALLGPEPITTREEVARL